MSRSIPVLPLWAFVACYKVTFTFTFTFTIRKKIFKQLKKMTLYGTTDLKFIIVLFAKVTYVLTLGTTKFS